MTVPDIIIAIDGCSSTGKSSFARKVAASFSFIYLDSGAMYRGVTYFAQQQGLINAQSEIDPSLQERLKGLNLGFDTQGHTCIDGISIEQQIRSMEVSEQVSPIAALPYVRDYVDERLHLMASKGRVVMDGRDIGTTVFPDAQLKIFMTASPEVRAQRRYDELKAKGGNPSMEQVRRNLEERDYIDSHRETSPLKRAEDSFLLDNTEMSFEDELNWIRGLVQGKFGILE